MNNENEVIERPEETIGEAMPSRPTRRDLMERGLDALDPSKMSSAKVSISAGGVTFASVVEVMDFAKTMATAGMMIPKYLRGNPGGCLGITFQAIEWRMSPFQVANKSYSVNDRVGFESQLIHAVVEARAPLQHRLDCRYDGEGATRTCTIVGMFISGDTREYTSPEIGKIRVKNSPLWVDDPDQQLFYYASRAWARKWCPDVLMGIYAREELAERPDMGREVSDDAPGLHARLAGSERSAEGHQDGHAVRELDQIAGKGQTIDHDPATGPDTGAEAAPDGVQEPDGTGTRPKANKRTTDQPRGGSKRTKQEKAPKKADPPAESEKSRAAKLSEEIDAEIKQVKTADQYLKYARKWIKACDDSTELFVRWTAERKLRNALGVTADDREPLDKLITKRREELES
jgi:RecT family